MKRRSMPRASAASRDVFAQTDRRLEASLLIAVPVSIIATVILFLIVG